MLNPGFDNFFAIKKALTLGEDLVGSAAEHLSSRTAFAAGCAGVDAVEQDVEQAELYCHVADSEVDDGQADHETKEFADDSHVNLTRYAWGCCPSGANRQMADNCNTINYLVNFVNNSNRNLSTRPSGHNSISAHTDTSFIISSCA